MVDTFTHGGMLTIPAMAVSVTLEPLLGYSMFELHWLVILLAGSIAPDIIGEPLVWIASSIDRKRKRAPPEQLGWKLWLYYNKRLTKELEQLDNEYPKLFASYWLLHSYWGVPLLSVIVWFFAGWWLAFAWFVGHFVHTVVDRYTHKVSRPYYPWPRKINGASEDWWNSKIYKHLTGVVGLGEVPTIYIIVVPIDAMGIFHLTLL